APDPATGQALWGYGTAAAGLAIALLSPPLGAIADAAGRRKPWILAFSVLLVGGSLSLWFAVPGGDFAVAVALLGYVVGTIGAEFAIVFTNAMMPDLVDRERLGRLSGTGWAVGYVGGVVSLFFVLGFLVANPETGLTLFDRPALFGLDPSLGEGDRATGPYTAIWYVVFVLPLFLFTPDTPKRRAFGAAVGWGLADLRATLRALPGHRDIAVFLVARMIYADGLVALFAFGGIYAAGVFGWSTTEVGLFGVLIALTGTVGAFIGGRLDDRFGPKTVIVAALLLLTLAALGILATDRNGIAFVFAAGSATDTAGLYGTLPERVYLGLGGLIGLAAGPLQAASRTLLIRLSPPERLTQFFGLFALSGKMTSFVGPFLVGLLTALSGSQKVGISVLIAFFLGGIWLLMRVNDKK
ncbi:MAG: MFS transporter, partial [Hyphomicrobiales bacterium]|nr:MFS transporter [Hyphomicrobiales bacterium]